MPAAQVVHNSNQMADSAAILKEIEELKNSGLETGEVWFLVDQHWYQKMMDYLQGNGDFPGPVDNSALIEDDASATPQLKSGLQDELDYILVPERGWNMIREKFGIMTGQSPISRKVIDMGVFVKRQTVEVYPLELNLSLYTNPENVNTIYCSRASTPTDLKKEARTKFHLGSAAQIRLYLKMENNAYEPVPEDKSHAPLEDLSFASKQSIVIDVEKDGKWHIDPNERSGTQIAGPSNAYRSPERAFSPGNKPIPRAATC